MEKFKQIYDNFLNALFPKDIKCIVCDDELPTETRYCICSKCYNNLPKSSSHICLKCGESLASQADYCLACKDHIERYFTKARSPFLYDGDIKKLVHDLKYNNKQYLGEYLSKIMLDEYLKHNFKADVVVPIPLNIKREKQRGYNQSLLLVKDFDKKLGITIDTANFKRVKDTPTQTSLTKDERRKNLENSFKVVNKSAFKNKTILLVDDVYTTGSTLEEASKVLINSGAKEVYCLTLAHTMPAYLKK